MIAVITPTIPERSRALEDCKASVAAQSFPADHFIRLDTIAVRCGAVRNAIVRDLDPCYDWLAFLDDDDIMLPDHLALLAEKSENADIVYSDCRTEGWEKSWVTRAFDDTIFVRNFIPVTVLMRRSMFEKAGGFGGCFAEDWELWKWCATLGARFQYVPKVTWVYRRLDQSMLVRGF